VVRFSAEASDSSFLENAQTGCGPSRPSIQPTLFPREYSGRIVKLILHFHLVNTMCGPVPPLPYTCMAYTWSVSAPLYTDIPEQSIRCGSDSRDAIKRDGKIRESAST